MVPSISECPIQSCTVRKSTPPHSAQVANVARNLCSQKSSGFSFARMRDHFAGIKEIQLWLAPGGGEQNRATRIAVRFPFLQRLYKLVRDGNLAAFVSFWREAVLAFIADSYDSTVEVKIGPSGVHHFLLPHTGHQKELKPLALVLIACSKEFVEVFALADFGFILNVAGPVIPAGETANVIGLEKGHHILELVVDGAGLKFFHVAPES